MGLDPIYLHGTSEEKMDALVSSMLRDDLFKDIVGLSKLLDEITTTPDKTEEELIEMNILLEEEKRKLINRSKSISSEYMDVLSVKICIECRYMSLLMEIYGAVNTRIEKNHHLIGAYMDFESQKRNLLYSLADINLLFTVISVRIYKAVIRNETNRMMKSIDTLEAVAFDLFGTERKRVFFDLLDNRLLRFESSSTISCFIPNMIDPTIIQEVLYFLEHELTMINRLKTSLLSCPDGERLRQRSNEDFTSLIKSAFASTFNETTTTRPIFFMIDSDVFEGALKGISQDFVNNLVVPADDNVRQVGNGASETIESRPVQCIYFPSDCRLFIYIPTEIGSYWHQLDMQRAR